MKQLKSGPFDSSCQRRSRTGENGFAALLMVWVIFMCVVVYIIAYIFLLERELAASGIELGEQQALFIAEAGIERSMEALEADTDWSNNNGTAVIAETFGAGSYSIDLSSGTRASIVVTSTGSVAGGPQQVSRQIRQTIRRLPEAFNYALFWAGGDSLDVQNGTVNINGGDVFTADTVGDISTGTINVVGAGVPSTLNGGFVYTTLAWTAAGTYTTGTLPGDLPAYPTLDTTYYDTEITTAIAMPTGNVTWVGAHVLAGNLYVDGTFTSNAATITGSGTIAASGNITIQLLSSVTPSAGGTIRFITAGDIQITGTPAIATRTVCYARGLLRINTGVTNLRGTFIAVDTVRMDANTALMGVIYADRARLLNTVTINGSVVANRFQSSHISGAGAVVTINYDDSNLEDAPPGLGLDIDGDINDEGNIVRVPETWQQL